TCRICFQRTCVCSQILPCRLTVSHCLPCGKVYHPVCRGTMPFLELFYRIYSRTVHDSPSSGKPQLLLHIPHFQSHISTAQIVIASGQCFLNMPDLKVLRRILVPICIVKCL